MHRQIAGKLTGPVTKWLVVFVWLGLAVVASGFAQKLTEVQNNEAASWLPGDAESTQALDKLAKFQDPDEIPTTVVYQRDGGLTPADHESIAAQAEEIGKLDGVTGKVADPFSTPTGVSKDREVAQTLVTFNFGKDGWNEMPGVVDKLREIAPEGDGLQVHVAGGGGQAADAAESFEGLDSTLLFSAAGVVIIILLLTYRSPVLWLLPVISAGVALVVAQAVIYFAAEYGSVTVNGQSQGILTVLVFGAGTDYALLLVARYREELRRHENRHEAMAFALHRAAPAIVASAATVILGMLCLLFADMNSTAGLGPVAAIGIGVGLLVMITLLPALLVVTGRWIFWPRRPGFGTVEPTATGFWARLGNRISVSPRKVWIGTSVVLAIACLGLFKLDANGLTNEEQYTQEFDSIVGQKVLTEHDMVDTSSPLMVATNTSKAKQVAGALADVDGLGPSFTSPDSGGTTLVSAPLSTDATSPDSFVTVEKARDAVGGIDGADALVGGSSAILLDMDHANNHDNRLIIPLVLLVVMVILMVLLRAVVAPLLLMLTVVLSFGAALGLSALLFHYVFGFAGADASLPLFIFVFLVALGIDYNIFLMTRVREETATLGTRRGALVALSATGGVITSAGLVLAATFLVMSTMPLVMFVEIGVAVALGVMLDTLVVRSVLVTALNLDLGPKIWWPSSLDRGDVRRAVDPEPNGDPDADPDLAAIR